MKTWQTYIAEAYGTFVLVALGTGAILATDFDVVGISLAFGLALVVGLYTVGHISGGHFNPAVSLAMFLDRRLALPDLIGYWVSQLVGAVLGSLTVAWILTRELVGATVTRVGSPIVGELEGLVGEIVLTAVFVLTILVVTWVA
jgi:aquaporin Z